MGDLTDDPYADGTLYDMEYAHHDEDVVWYTLQARLTGGPVLELGCGTGRLTLPIARTGLRVTGVDRAPAMIATLRGKLAEEPRAVQRRVQVVEADYQSTLQAGEFGAVLWPFNALHHCADTGDVRRILEGLRARVQPGGRLAMDCYLPDVGLYDRDPEARFEHRVFADPRSGSTLHSWEQGWWDPENHVHHVLYVYKHQDGREERTRLQLRMFTLDELRALLVQSGWQLVHEARDFLGTPVADDALKWVALAAPA